MSISVRFAHRYIFLVALILQVRQAEERDNIEAEWSQVVSRSCMQLFTRNDFISNSERYLDVYSQDWNGNRMDPMFMPTSEGRGESKFSRDSFGIPVKQTDISVGLPQMYSPNKPFLWTTKKGTSATRSLGAMRCQADHGYEGGQYGSSERIHKLFMRSKRVCGRCNTMGTSHGTSE